MAIAKPFDIGPKLVSAERAVSPIRAGSRIYIGTGCAAVTARRFGTFWNSNN
jgi:hypothetical protein